MADATGRQGRLPWLTILMAVGVLGTGLAATTVVSLRLQENAERDIALRLDQYTERINAELERRVLAPLYGLEGLRGLYAASTHVDRLEFRAFVMARDISDEYPGVRGFGVIEPVPRAGLDHFVARQRQDDAPDFTVWAADTDTGADVLYVVTRMEPLIGNETALGFDIGSESRRRLAVESALRTGQPVISAPVQLMAGAGPGHLYLLPIFGGDGETIVGLAFAPIVLQKQLDGVGAAADGMIRVRIEDVAAGRDPALIYDSLADAPPALQSGPLERRLGLGFGGRTWQARLTPTTAFMESTHDSLTPLAAVGGSILSMLLAALVMALGLSRDRAYEMARRMTDEWSLAAARAEDATGEAESAREQMAAFMECAPVSIMVANENGVILYCNRGFGQSSREDIAGESWLAHIPVEQHGKLMTSFASALDAGRQSMLTVPMLTGGREARVYVFHFGPMRHGERISGVVIAVQDVTDEHRTHAELAASQRLATVGSLAAGIAHEINTPVQFVGDSVHFLKDASTEIFQLVDALLEVQRGVLSGEPEDVLRGRAEAVSVFLEESDLDYIRENVPGAFDRSMDGLDRVATIVRSMKEFSHPAQREMAAVDLNRAIRSTLTVGRNEYKYVADLQTDFEDIPAVLCHVNDINQAVLNIVINAAHAIADRVGASGEKGRITVGTRLDGEAVEISIADTGNGIPEGVRDRIFDPFFTTKEVGRGTGQGLAIAWATIREKHGGELWFTTEAGVGTTFFIRLPVAGAAVVPEPARGAQDRAA